jgi:hypothetical protein
MKDDTFRRHCDDARAVVATWPAWKQTLLGGQPVSDQSTQKPIMFVGEANPYGTDPRHALFPLPRGSAGANLRRYTGLRRSTYLTCPRVNLCPSKWSLKTARARAVEIACGAGAYCAVVLLGAKVRDAFGLADHEFFSAVTVGPVTFVLLPHPSGLSRPWNEPGAVARARDLLSTVCDLPFGEADEPQGAIP